jgi:hypothetical protein
MGLSLVECDSLPCMDGFENREAELLSLSLLFGYLLFANDFTIYHGIKSEDYCGYDNLT